MWMVMGKKLNLWKDPWIPSLPRFKPVANPSLFSISDIKLSHLIHSHSSSWNIKKLNKLFDPLTVNNVLKIHLSSLSFPHIWTWVPSPPQVNSLSLSSQPTRLSKISTMRILVLFFLLNGNLYGAWSSSAEWNIWKVFDKRLDFGFLKPPKKSHLNILTFNIPSIMLDINLVE